MNAAYTNNRRAVTAKRYPNEADRSYFLNRLAENFLYAASSGGILAILYFLFTMC